jgi:uncharacterized phage protein (TIGR01671 family)
MSREIKFRAFVDGKMTECVQPLFDSETPTKCMVPDMGITFYEPSGTKRYWYEVPVTSIMQFTGLKDKNGIDIYEGDLLIFNDDSDKNKRNPITVQWSNKSCGFAMKRKGWAFEHFFGEAGDASDCIVVGNIHENK